MNWKDKIRNADCTDCPLHESAEYVCLMGSGKRSAKVMVVGEAPGAREDETHAAFVGQAGQLLTKLLEEAGFKRDDCYITNAVKCRPPENATPKRGEVKACAQYLAEEIDQVDPEIIIGLGNTALQALTGRSGITKYRGKVYRLGNAKILCTFHPAAALRSAQYLPAIQADFAATRRLIDGVRGPRTRTSLITTTAGVRALCKTLEGASTIAYDLETSGLHEWVDDAKIVTLGVSWEPGRAAVVRIDHVTGGLKRGWLDLKRVLEDPTKKYVAHNEKFDRKWLARFGIFVPLGFDTMIAAHVLDENRAKGLKPLSQMLLGADDYAEDTKDCYNADLKRLAIYNGKDCDYTLRLYYLFRQHLKEQPRLARLFKFLMMPASDVFTKLEAMGTYVDSDRLRKRYKEASKKVAKLEKEMGAEINYNSPAQVGHWLFNQLKLPVIEETATGAPSTKESVLLQLAKRDERVAALLEYRKWSKYLTTYILPWSERRDRHHRIHPSYRLTGTVTGRLSSAEPNLQQVPRNRTIRGILGAPPGWVLVEADYSQVELRIAAWMANETTMMKILASGEDLHANTAKAITGKSEIDGEDRVIWGKHPNFGLLFSMKPPKYQEYVLENSGQEITLTDAMQVYRVFHETYPRLKAWHDRQIRVAKAQGYVSNPLGRVRHLPDIHTSSEAERQAINAPVQATASDLMLCSAIRLGALLDTRIARLCGSVHDSLLFEVRDSEVDATVPTIRKVMEDMSWVKRKFGTNITVPIVVEIKVGTHWGEGTVVDA